MSRILYEMFLPEARFPIEKFWDRDGDPIHAPPKGPRPGATGMTHKDIGARDQDDNIWDDSKHPNLERYEAGEIDTDFPGSLERFEGDTGKSVNDADFYVGEHGEPMAELPNGIIWSWDEHNQTWWKP